MTDEVDEVTENFSEEEKSEESEIIDPIKTLEEKIQELEKEKQYSTAEIVNLRQRYARERNTLVKFSSMDLASKILPVLDNLEKAISIENNESEKFIEGSCGVFGADFLSVIDSKIFADVCVRSSTPKQSLIFFLRAVLEKKGTSIIVFDKEFVSRFPSSSVCLLPSL